MNTRFLRSAILVAFAAFSTCGYAQDDSPGRVGRISLSQGQVSVTGEVGDEASAGLVNWPVTSRNQITTGRDSRTEIRVGSTAIRLDADSALDVAELDDDRLRLHLHYGSATIRVRNPALLDGFEMSTPQGIIRMQEAGQIRVDSGRRAETTVVSVFTGTAMVEGGGSRLSVRSGKRAEVSQDDLRTGLAMRDSFDEWSMLRDLRDERSESVRYVSSEMTGYEELDQHGVWRDSSEYGPLWSPRHVPAGWVPYRDGRWTYLQPWGWTWVDNAPWGYAPSHYGRWVMVNRRWAWAPGRTMHSVWAPALVGWVGGSNVSVTFGSARIPAQGWYPLTPHDSYVPGYRMRRDHLGYVNRHVDGRRGRHDSHGRVGMTVVPHADFARRGTVLVPTAPKPTGPMASLITGASGVLPPPPQDYRSRERRQQPPVANAPQQSRVQFGIAPPPQRSGGDRRPVEQVTAATPLVVEPQRGRRFERDADEERERRPRGAESFQMRQQQLQQQQLQQQQLQQQQAMQQRQFQDQQQAMQQRQLQDQQQAMQQRQLQVQQEQQREQAQRQAASQLIQQQRMQEQMQQQAAARQREQQQVAAQQREQQMQQQRQQQMQQQMQQQQAAQQQAQQQAQQAQQQREREQREQREQRAAQQQERTPAETRDSRGRLLHTK